MTAPPQGSSATLPPSPPSPWNVPNALTVARIAVVPFFAWCLIHDHGQTVSWRISAWMIFVAAMITDKLDGSIARARGIVTNFGKLADPIADKAITGTAFVLMSWLGLVPWWMTVLVIVRELGITVLRFVIMKYAIMPANRGGKLKTTWQSLVIGIAVLPFELWFGHWVTFVYWVLMAVATALTVVTGLDYVMQAVRLRREAKAKSA